MMVKSGANPSPIKNDSHRFDYVNVLMHTSSMRKKQLLIPFLIALVTGLVGFAVTQKKVNTNTTKAPRPTVYKTQQECEAATGRSCQFSMCDYKCAVYFKGWIVATDKVNQ